MESDEDEYGGHIIDDFPVEQGAYITSASPCALHSCMPLAS
jgi:hypothetical protein